MASCVGISLVKEGVQRLCHTVCKAVSHPRPLPGLRTSRSVFNDPNCAQMAMAPVPQAEKFLSGLGSCILLFWHSPFPDCTSTLPHFTTDPLHEHDSQTDHKCLKLESFGVSPLSGLILPYSSSQILKWSSPPSDQSSNRPSTCLSTARILVES